jgi:hypothetical protein
VSTRLSFYRGAIVPVLTQSMSTPSGRLGPLGGNDADVRLNGQDGLIAAGPGIGVSLLFERDELSSLRTDVARG